MTFWKRKQITFLYEGLKGVRAFAANGSNLANLSQGLISFHCGPQKKFYGLLFYYDKRLNFWLTPFFLVNSLSRRTHTDKISKITLSKLFTPPPPCQHTHKTLLRSYVVTHNLHEQILRNICRQIRVVLGFLC